MNTGKTIFELDQAIKIPASSRYIVEMGDGSGTKSVTHEDVVAAVGEYLPLGDIENLETDVKTDYVSAINEIKKKADASSGGATLQVKTSDPGLYGRTVTISDGENEMSAVMSFGGECVITGILMAGDLTVSASTEEGETDETEIHVDNYATYHTDLDTRSGYYRLNVFTSDTGLIGKAVTVSNGEDMVTGIISQDGRARLVFAFTGAVTVSASDNAGNIVSASINVGSDTTSYDVWLQAGNMISDAFSEGMLYSAGDYAIYKDALYRFTAAKTAGAWDPETVTPVTVAGVLRELNEKTADMFKVVQYQYDNATVPAGGTAGPIAPKATNIPDGYTPVSIYSFAASSGIVVRNFITSNGQVYLENLRSTEKSSQIIIRVLCVKSGFSS